MACSSQHSSLSRAAEPRWAMAVVRLTTWPCLLLRVKVASRVFLNLSAMRIQGPIPALNLPFVAVGRPVKHLIHAPGVDGPSGRGRLPWRTGNPR